jgi:plasmid stabilization system protein ParE
MSREIKWSRRATEEWVEVLEHWIKRNKSYTYSSKLDKLLKDTLKLIEGHPEFSQMSDYPAVRVKTFRDYSIYYRVDSEYIEILSIRDSRRDPQKFKL